MRRLELDQNVGVLPRNAIGLVVGEVERQRDTDIVAYAFEFARRDYLADRLFYALYDLFSTLDSSAGRRAHVQAHHARVDGREKILADDHEQRQRTDDHQSDRRQTDRAMGDEGFECRRIQCAQALKTRLESAQKTAHESAFVKLLMRFGQQV